MKPNRQNFRQTGGNAKAGLKTGLPMHHFLRMQQMRAQQDAVLVCMLFPYCAVSPQDEPITKVKRAIYLVQEIKRQLKEQYAKENSKRQQQASDSQTNQNG